MGTGAGSAGRRPEVLGGGADVAQLADALDLGDDLLAVPQPDPAGLLGQAHAGGVNTAAGTAITAMPKPMSASPPAARRCSATWLRMRNRQ